MYNTTVRVPAVRSLARRFCRSSSGNVTMIFGLSAVTLFGTIGGAIDCARWFQVRNKVQAAMDSASLAGGRNLQISQSGNSSEAIAVATGYFNQMKPADLVSGTPTFTVTENGTVIRGEIDFSIPSPFLALFGHASLGSRVVSETVVAVGGNAGTNLEISIMLDTTGSMSGQKIEDLKDAAKDLVDIIVWQDQSQYTSKVALAPFSQRVNVGDYLDKVTDVNATRTFSGNALKGITCVTERTGTNAFTDERPNGADTIRAYSADTGAAAKDNQSNYSSDGVCRTGGWNPVEIPRIMPLSSDKQALKDHIDSLPAAGSTAGSLGTAWAWYLLSPKWDGIWQGDSMPAPYSDITTLGPQGQPKLQKVAVLMSDGIYNTTGGQNYGDSSSEATTISNNAVSLCNNMKAAGVKVYTVGFHLGSNQLAIDTLKACASREATDPADAPSYFFNTTTGDELRGAFRQIALTLSSLRIRK